MDNKSLQIRKENIFTKLRNFLFNIFNKKSQTIIEQNIQTEISNENNTNEQRQKFLKDLKFVQNQEEISLSQLIKQGKLKIKNLTSEQKQKMISFYKEKNILKKKKLLQLKKKLLETI